MIESGRASVGFVEQEVARFLLHNQESPQTIFSILFAQDFRILVKLDDVLDKDTLCLFFLDLQLFLDGLLFHDFFIILPIMIWSVQQ